MKRLLHAGIVIGLLTTVVCAQQGGSPPGNNPADAGQLSFMDWSEGLPSTSLWRQAVAIFDINKDGYLDIAAPPPRKAPKGKDVPFVWLGDGKGKWTESRLDVPSEVPYDYGGITLADFDGDGIADMGLAMHGKGMKVLKGKGDGKYVDFSTGLPSPTEFMSRCVVSADFKHDKIPDLVAVSEAKFGPEFPNPVGLNICRLVKDAWVCHPVGEATDNAGLFADQLVAGDVNGDGNRDLAVASLVHYKSLIVWLGDGNGGFAPFNKGLPTERHYLSVALADINGDGKDDLAASVTGIGAEAFKGLKAFLSGPDGFEEISEGLPSDEVFFAVASGDLDGDGKAEIVAGSDNLTFFSYRDGRWQKLNASGLPDKGLMRIHNIYLVDMNQDGRKDIVLNHSMDKDGTGGIRVFLNVPAK